MGKTKTRASGSPRKTRKEKRKEQRILKKVKRNEHYFKKFKKEAPMHPSRVPKEPNDNIFTSIPLKSQKVKEAPSEDDMTEGTRPQEKSLIEKIRETKAKTEILAEKRKISEKKSRNAQLREANKAEEKQIKHLATLMKMNKRKKNGKTSSLPKIFASDGLDYLLDVTDPEKLNDMKLEEPTFDDDEEEGDFERDLAMATGGSAGENRSETGEADVGRSSDDGREDGDSEEGSEAPSDDETEEDAGQGAQEEGLGTDEVDGSEGTVAQDDDDSVNSRSASLESEEQEDSEEGDQSSDVDVSDVAADITREGSETPPYQVKEHRKRKSSEDPDAGEMETDQRNTAKKKRKRQKEEAQDAGNDGIWEDIYGRMRGKDGSILSGVAAAAGDGGAPPERYLPPALRAQQLAPSVDQLARRAQLRRRLQGQLNRLSAASARGVLALLEELYAANSRHDTSQALTELVHEACVSPAAVRPDRLVMEHVLLLAALHANVGSEVGAHFLLKTSQRFHKLLMADERDDESKELDNLIMLLAHLYTFRVTDSTVIYDVLNILVERFSAKDVELILAVLRSVGFTMRKDDPAALKELILRLQTQAAAASASSAAADSSRVRFLLDIVMALRNNNMTKIPHYDPVLGQELNKLLKTLVSPGQTVTELNISLDDLLKAEERGKWWVVGSAWSGALKERQPAGATRTEDTPPAADRTTQQYSAQLLQLAREQRMNTDLRRTVFCVLMTAEDYLDGFENLMRLGLKGQQQEQEMTTVILGCALRERTYNAYYSHLLERLCAADRKYQMRVKISVWDQVRQLPELGAAPASNLAKVLAHLISSGQLSIAVLKAIEFSEMSKPIVRFLRQLLLALLLGADDTEAVGQLFQRASSVKLKHLRDSLVLFLHHFVLRNKHRLTDGGDHTALTLEERTKAAVGALRAADGRLKL